MKFLRWLIGFAPVILLGGAGVGGEPAGVGPPQLRRPSARIRGNPWNAADPIPAAPRLCRFQPMKKPVRGDG